MTYSKSWDAMLSAPFPYDLSGSGPRETPHRAKIALRRNLVLTKVIGRWEVTPSDHMSRKSTVTHTDTGHPNSTHQTECSRIQVCLDVLTQTYPT